MNRAPFIFFTVCCATSLCFGDGNLENVGEWLKDARIETLRLQCVRDVDISFTVHYRQPAQHGGASIKREERTRVWYKGDNRWRHNTDFVEGSVSYYHDAAIAERHAWMMTDSELAVFDPSVGFPPARNIPESAEFFKEPLAELLYPGVRSLPTDLIEDIQTTENGEGFVIVLQPAQGIAATIIGGWLESLPIIHEVRFEPGGVFSDRSVSRVVAGDWRYEPSFSAPIAGRVTWYGASGEVRRVFVTGDIQPLDARMFQEISAVPSPVIGDAIRGVPRWARPDGSLPTPVIRDYRLNREHPLLREPGKPLRRVRGFLAWMESGTGLRAIGWISGVTVLAAVLIVRARYSSSRARSSA